VLPYGLGRLWHDFWRRGIEDGAAQVIREVFPTGSDSGSPASVPWLKGHVWHRPTQGWLLDRVIRSAGGGRAPGQLLRIPTGKLQA